MRELTCLLACLLQLTLGAQDTTALFKQLRTRSEEAAREKVDSAPDYLREAYQSRDEFLMQEVRDSAFIFDQQLHPYLDSLMRRIARANGLPVEPILLLDRAPEPNARSLGTGVFVVNLGLLRVLPREEELTFVLSHELAHDHLGHHVTGLREASDRWAEIMPSLRKLSRPSLWRSKRKDYRLNVALRDNYYGIYRSKRRAELEADSLALVYFETMQLSPRFAVSALLGLEGRPREDSLSDRHLVTLLETEDYTIEDRWLTPLPKLFGSGTFGQDQAASEASGFWQRDSLTTHPALPERRAALTSNFPPAVDDSTTENGLLHPLMPVVRRTMVDSYLLRGEHGTALVAALRLLSERPDDPVLKELAGQALLGVYLAADAHDFDAAVPPASYFHDAASKTLISMLRRMNTAELKKLTETYLTLAAPKAFAEAQDHFTP